MLEYELTIKFEANSDHDARVIVGIITGLDIASMRAGTKLKLSAEALRRITWIRNLEDVNLVEGDIDPIED